LGNLAAARALVIRAPFAAAAAAGSVCDILRLPGWPLKPLARPAKLVLLTQN